MRVIVVENISQGIKQAKKELYHHVDEKTVLFLSGGSTPKPLYESLAQEKRIKPAVVALIDERYGMLLHNRSNERMIAQTELINYFHNRKIPLKPILKEDVSLEETARQYEQTVKKLFSQFPKSVGILGIGADGHTAGIPARNSEFRIQNSEIYKTQDVVTSYTDTTGTYGERITMTFAGLSLLDFILVFVFGKDKKDALQKALIPGSLEEIPARFFQKPEIAEKTVVITDQTI